MTYPRRWIVFPFALLSALACSTESVEVNIQASARVNNLTPGQLAAASVTIVTTKGDGYDVTGETFSENCACYDDGSTEDLMVGYNLHGGEVITVAAELVLEGMTGYAETSLSYETLETYRETDTPYAWNPVLTIDAEPSS